MVDVELGRVHLARVRGTPHVVERSQELVRRRPSDAIVAYLTLAGEAFFYHQDAVCTLQPGQLLVCDTDRPFLRGFSRRLEELVFKVPRGIFSDLTGLDTVGMPILMEFGPADGRVEARTLARLIGRAVHLDQAWPANEEALLQLLGQMLVPRSGADLREAHLATAKTFIDEHIADPNLAADRIAAGIGISERHLSRVFSVSGASIPQHVLTRRLDRAKAMLLADPELGIADLAARNGIASASYFSQAFREHFGERPSDVRRAAKANRRP